VSNCDWEFEGGDGAQLPKTADLRVDFNSAEVMENRENWMELMLKMSREDTKKSEEITNQNDLPENGMSQNDRRKLRKSDLAIALNARENIAGLGIQTHFRGN
jgi:hypothetical protein